MRKVSGFLSAVTATMRGKIFLGMVDSFVEFSPFEGQHRLMGSRPCQRLGDLGRSRFSSNHRQIRNPHQHLKIRRNDVEMRRPVIVGVDTDADGAKALQCRHTNASINSATIALLPQNVKDRLPTGRTISRQSASPACSPRCETIWARFADRADNVRASERLVALEPKQRESGTGTGR